jgi:hypothetical protein
MMRLPGYRWPVGVERTPANRRVRLPPRHWNPEPKFGLRVAPPEPLRLDDGDYIAYQQDSIDAFRLALASSFDLPRLCKPLRDDDYIVFANDPVQFIVDPRIPSGEMHVVQGQRVVAKVVNLGDGDGYEGRCETTNTERYANPACACPTYEGNMGPCRTWLAGLNGRCAYCDHLEECHST